VLRIDSTDGHFINTQRSKLNPQLFSTLRFGGIQGGYTFVKANDPIYPSKGFKWEANLKWTDQLTSTNEFLLRLSGAVTGYIPIGSIVMAHRTGISTITSKEYPFYQGPALDGNINLRGYWRTRFYGTTAFYQNTELRVKLGEANNHVLRGSLGLIAFYDNGRVWTPDESSTKWHTGYGGGLFFIAYNYVALNCTYGISHEAKVIQVKAGFFF
jgi:outer membrane translocation and assembly module TamA